MADAAEKIEASGGKILKGVNLMTLAEIAKVDGGADPDDLFGGYEISRHKGCY